MNLSKIKPYVLIASLVVTREVNLTRLFGWDVVSNFVDVIINPGIILIGVLLLTQLRHIPRWLLLTLGINMVSLMVFGSGGWYHFFYTWFIIAGWVVLVGKKDILKIGWALLPIALFDHVLLSSVYPLLIVVTAKTLYEVNKSKLIFIPLAVHGVCAIYQTIAGKSLGLHLIGEKYLDLTTQGVAKTELFGETVLRGYGLFAHPIILGFFGLVVWIYFAKARYEAGFLMVLAQSRAIFLGLLLRVKSKFIWLLVLPLLLLFAVRVTGSDIYRYQDAQNYIDYTTQNPTHLFFGVGVGNYSHSLQTLEGLEWYEYQPVHNIGLLLITELGLVPLIIIFMTKQYID